MLIGVVCYDADNYEFLLSCVSHRFNTLRDHGKLQYFVRELRLFVTRTVKAFEAQTTPDTLKASGSFKTGRTTWCQTTSENNYVYTCPHSFVIEVVHKISSSSVCLCNLDVMDQINGQTLLPSLRSSNTLME